MPICSSCCFSHTEIIGVKLLVVGDMGVGKTCLFISHSTDAPPGEYIPKVFDGYATVVTLDGKRYNIFLWDTCGEEVYDRLRPLAYPQTDIFLLCFDVTDRKSLDHIESKWIPEINHHNPETPRILVGCKADLRATTGGLCIPTVDILNFAKRLNLNYYETSSWNMTGIHECFDDAIRIGGQKE